MKKLNSLLLVFFFAGQLCAQSPKEIFLSSEITWFGLDFSNAKFLGSFTTFDDKGQKTGQQIRDEYFPGWNYLITKESEKYNFKIAYKKSLVSYDLEVVKQRNSAVNPDEIFSDKPEAKNHLKSEDIAKIIKEYKTDKTGTGLVYIIDNFDKAGEEGVMWVTFFDMATKTVLLTERFADAPRGFGIKNYWARTILGVIEQSGKKYKSWEKQYK